MVINFRAVRLPKVKTLAEDWFEPQLEECRIAFPRAVQRKLGDAARRGMAHSPPTYGEVEILAEKEVERCGQIFLAGYKQAFEAVSNPIRSATLAQVKRDLDTLLTSESDRVLKTIQYVREACQPVPAKDAVKTLSRRCWRFCYLFLATCHNGQRQFGRFFRLGHSFPTLLKKYRLWEGFWLPLTGVLSRLRCALLEPVCSYGS